MGNNTWNNTLDPFSTARGPAVNTFTAFRDVAGTTGNPGSLPTTIGNELKLGSIIHLDARGEFSCATGITYQLGFIYNAVAGAAGGTTLAASGVITTGTNPAAWPWVLEWEGLITSIGLAGANSVIYGQGTLQLGTSLIAFALSAIPITAAARQVSIDTTIKALWGVGCAIGTSGAGNGVRVDSFNVLIENQGKSSG